MVVAAREGGDQATVDEEVAEAKGANWKGCDTLEDAVPAWVVAAWVVAAWVALAMGGAEGAATAAAAALAVAAAVAVDVVAVVVSDMD